MHYYIDSLLSAVSLAMDAFAVALCVGSSAKTNLRGIAVGLGVTCGAFQFLMPFIGWLLGEYALSLFASVDHWVAFILLSYAGGSMIRSSFEEDSHRAASPEKPAELLYLGLATSMDALAVGASFAISGRSVTLLAMGAGTVTCALCYLGVIIGRRVGSKMGKKAEGLGGTILIAIGISILYSHLS
jgi:putative Mn2+ efflux pump MntP